MIEAIQRLAIADITVDGGIQARVEIDRVVVNDYRRAMEAGAEFPPVVVFHDGSQYWLSDGFHRVVAKQLVNHVDTLAEVRQGGKRDAILWAVRANDTHGLRRTNADKRHAVQVLLLDAEWRRRSDRWIGERCGVSPTTVGKEREKLGIAPGLPEESTPAPTKQREKRLMTTNTSNANQNSPTVQLGQSHTSDQPRTPLVPRKGRDGRDYAPKRKDDPKPDAATAPKPKRKPSPSPPPAPERGIEESSCVSEPGSKIPCPACGGSGFIANAQVAIEPSPPLFAHVKH